MIMVSEKDFMYDSRSHIERGCHSSILGNAHCASVQNRAFMGMILGKYIVQRLEISYYKD